MFRWVKRHWLAIFGAVPLLVPLIRFAKWLVTLGGDVDFLVSRSEDPGWVGAMVNFIIDPPNWSIAPMIMAGLILIWLDGKRSRPAATVERAAEPDYARLNEPAAPLKSTISSRVAYPAPLTTNLRDGKSVSPIDKVRNLLDAELSEAAIAAYVRSSDLVKGLDREIARYGEQKLERFPARLNLVGGFRRIA